MEEDRLADIIAVVTTTGEDGNHDVTSGGVTLRTIKNESQQRAEMLPITARGVGLNRRQPAPLQPPATDQNIGIPTVRSRIPDSEVEAIWGISSFQAESDLRLEGGGRIGPLTTLNGRTGSQKKRRPQRRLQLPDDEPLPLAGAICRCFALGTGTNYNKSTVMDTGAAASTITPSQPAAPPTPLLQPTSRIPARSGLPHLPTTATRRQATLGLGREGAASRSAQMIPSTASMPPAPVGHNLHAGHGLRLGGLDLFNQSDIVTCSRRDESDYMGEEEIDGSEPDGRRLAAQLPQPLARGAC